MMRRLSLALLVSLLGLSSVSALPALAQETNTKDEAKTLGKKGIYGRSTMDPEDESSAPAAVDPEEQERIRKLNARYPLSVTSQTGVNQKAHEHMLKGIYSYNLTRAIFEAANKIESTFDSSTTTLKVKQTGVIKARLQPRDLIEFGPQNAYLGVRIRALRDAEREINSAISQFNQARSLAPSNAAVQKWIKVSTDTRKAIAYHIRFYTVSGKGASTGMTDQQLKDLAQLWKQPPLALKPTDTVVTTVRTRIQVDTKSDKTLDAGKVVDLLPNLDFKVDIQ
jgi:hypothetical protein